jgi:hypothetical protein
MRLRIPGDPMIDKATVDNGGNGHRSQKQQLRLDTAHASATLGAFVQS